MTSLETSDTVSHETNTVETYIVVDVETTGLNPSHDRVLTIGAVAVHYDRKIATIDEDFFYQTINQTDWMDDTQWLQTLHQPDSTLSWWLEQSTEVQKAAWRWRRADETNAVDERTATNRFNEWLITERIKNWQSEPIFVANPASFDKPFVDQLFYAHGYDNPFNYRTLCLRSMAYGRTRHEPWGTQLRTNKPLVPHHAFFDAYAEAHDLVDLLNDRDESGYDDGLYWLHDPKYATYKHRLASIEGKGWHGNY